MKNKFFAFILALSLFIPFNVGVNATTLTPPNISAGETVSLGGQTVGIAIYTKGLLVSETSSFEDEKGVLVVPAEKAGIKKGDYIISANGIELTDVSTVDAVLAASEGEEIKIVATRNNKEYTTKIKPVKSRQDNDYHLGLWLKDSAAGLGTITFSSEEKQVYFALGHPITDFESGVDIEVSSGRIVKCTINSIRKGKNGTAGEIRGSFSVSATQLGDIYANTKTGIFGKTNEGFPHGKEIMLGDKNQASEGKASIFCSVEGQVKEYTIEILSINRGKSEKNMVIKVTDPTLLEKTGGIVQGMSGSPIVQDGKLIGAVTHVMIADSSCGYGIFAENMIKTAQSLAENILKKAS